MNLTVFDDHVVAVNAARQIRSCRDVIADEHEEKDIRLCFPVIETAALH